MGGGKLITFGIRLRAVPVDDVSLRLSRYLSPSQVESVEHSRKLPALGRFSHLSGFAAGYATRRKQTYAYLVNIHTVNTAVSFRKLADDVTAVPLG